MTTYKIVMDCKGAAVERDDVAIASELALQKMMGDLKMNVADVARVCNHSQSAIYQYLRGDISIPFFLMVELGKLLKAEIHV